MKKNYVYVIAPLAGLLVFSGFYVNYSGKYEIRIAAIKKAEREALQAKLDTETLNRLKAANEAKDAQDRRKAEKLAKEQKDAEDTARREKAVQARNKAMRDADKLAAQAKRLAKDIDDEKSQMKTIEEDKKRSAAELTFLGVYVKKSEANKNALLATLDKIADADKKWDQAVKDAALAAKTKKQ
jgi:hypothetical protein